MNQDKKLNVLKETPTAIEEQHPGKSQKFKMGIFCIILISIMTVGTHWLGIDPLIFAAMVTGIMGVYGTFVTGNAKITVSSLQEARKQ